MPKIKKCRQTGKTIFPNEELAQKAKMRIWSHDPSADIEDLHTYRCEYCKGLHLGHKSYYEKKVKSSLWKSQT